MDKEQNYKKLDEMLSVYGLSYQDIESDFSKPLSKFDEYVGRKRNDRCVFIPSQTEILPSDIENGSYSQDTPSLKDWFEYDFRNETIMKHLGNQGVVKAVNEDEGILFKQQNGRLFLENDGNHRLFNFLLLYKTEMAAAKTEEEKKEVEKKFTLNKLVHYEHDPKAVRALKEYVEESQESLSPLVSRYIDRTGKTMSGDFVEFDPKSQTYNVVLNARQCRGVKKEDLEDCVLSAPKEPKGVKLWVGREKGNNGKTVYYASYYNYVFKTTDKEQFKITASRFESVAKKGGTVEFPNEYMAVYDMDSQTYDLSVESKLVSGNEQIPDKYAKPYVSFVNKNQGVIYHKLDESCRRSVEFENEYISESSFRMPYREYSKMNKEEFKQLEQTIIQEMRFRKELDGSIERGEEV